MTDAAARDLILQTEMSPDEIDAYLRTPRFCAVATLRKDGRPLVVPMGFVWQGDELYISAAEGRGINLRLARDPRISINIYNETFPTKYVLVEGRAERVDDPGLAIQRELCFRYMSPESGTQTMKDLDVDAFFENWVTEGGRVVWHIVRERTLGYDSSKKGDARAMVDLAAYSVSELERLKRTS